MLAPAINRQGVDGWDMMRAVEAVKRRADRSEDEQSLAAGDMALAVAGA